MRASPSRLPDGLQSRLGARHRPMGAPPAAMAGIGRLTRAVVLWGTAWTSTAGVSPLDAQPSEVAMLCKRRLSPVLRELLEERDPITTLHDLQVAVQRHATRLVGHALGVEMAARPALEALREAGIDVMVMKGPAVARFHQSPSTRSWTDVDLLVHPRRFSAAMSVLRSLGYVRSAESQQPWEWFDRVCLEGVNVDAGPLRALDLHHRVSPWALTLRLGADPLFARSTEGAVAGVPIRFPSAEDCLVIAALHVTNDLWKADPSLVSWRDVAVLTGSLGREGTDRAFTQAGLQWFGEVVWRSVVSIAGGPLDPQSDPSPWGTWMQRRRVQLLGWDGDTFVARHPLGWVVRLPPSRALAFVAGHAVPSPSYARGKHGGYRRYWRASAASLVAAGRGVDFRKVPVAPRHQER